MGLGRCSDVASYWQCPEEVKGLYFSEGVPSVQHGSLELHVAIYMEVN